MKKYRFEKSVLHEDGYAIIHNESGEKIAECEDAEKAHFLMTAANSFNLDEQCSESRIELEKEVERLKGLIKEGYVKMLVSRQFNLGEIDRLWGAYKTENKL